MKKLTQENAKAYALENFKKLPELYTEWNTIHSEEIINILDILISNKKINKEKLFALAWVHDIGKIKSEENHAKISVEILKEEFELDGVDIDCILNHGSSAEPKTKEGKLFRYADGLSLFVPKIINFKFYAEAKEGLGFEKIQESIKELYEKYKIKYSDSEEVLELLDKLFNITNKLN